MSRGEREPSVPCPLLSPPPDGGTPPRRGYGVLLPVGSNYPFGQNKSTDSKSMLLLLERLTRLELATSTLARWRSTR